MRIAYTAGPMRTFYENGGLYTWEYNIQVAKKAYDRAVMDGWYPISPHIMGERDKDAQLCTPEEYINRDLEVLRMVRPDIILLPRWECSSGARQEYDLAMQLGLDIYHYDEEVDGIYHLDGAGDAVYA
jgi:hypothetical protein